MTKPANFPERKRQRQIAALKRLGRMTAGKPEQGIEPKSNDAIFAALNAAIGMNVRDVRTKKQMATATPARAARRKFARA